MVAARHSVHFIYTAAMLLSGFFLSAQSLTLTISEDTITTDDQFVVTLDGELGNFTNYASLSDVPGLVTVFHSESFDYNASNKNAVIHQTYTMKAISAGDYTIGGAWIQAGSRRIYSNAVHLHVKAGANPISNGMVFMRAMPEKNTVYAGEKVRMNLYLYSSPDYSVSGDYPTATSYSGFWSEPDAEFYRTGDTILYIKGERFRRQTIHTEFLYPNATGMLQLPTYTYTCYLSRYDDDVYSYGSGDITFDLVSEPTTITVLDLPQHDTLPGYSGDVGQYKMIYSVSKDSTKCWEPVTYTMYITGTGNFQFMMTPQLSVPAGMRAINISSQDSITYEYDYDDDYDYRATESGKVFKYLITPEQEGTFDLSAISFTYFDPKKKQYVTLTSDSFRLHVAPGTKIAPDVTNNLPSSFFEKKTKPRNTILVGSIIAALILLPAGGFVYYRRRKKQKQLKAEEEARLAAIIDNPEYIPPPDKSLEQANALIHGASQYLQNGLVVPAVNNLYEALVARITGVAKMRREEISLNSLRYRLKLTKMSDQAIEEIIEQYEDLMLKRYTLSPADAAAAHVLIVRTSDLIRKMA